MYGCMYKHTYACVCRVSNSFTFYFIARECNKQGMKKKKHKTQLNYQLQANVEPDVRMGGIGFFSGTLNQD